MWFRRDGLVAKYFSHFSQGNAFVFWTLWHAECLLRSPLWVEANAHLSHLNGLSEECFIILCFLRSPEYVNARSHSLHLNGFSPVCILMCSVRLPFCVNLFPHSSHSNGFSPLCVPMWVFKTPIEVKLLLHCSHWYGRPTLCVSWCFWRVSSEVNVLLQQFCQMWKSTDETCLLIMCSLNAAYVLKGVSHLSQRKSLFRPIVFCH